MFYGLFYNLFFQLIFIQFFHIVQSIFYRLAIVISITQSLNLLKIYNPLNPFAFMCIFGIYYNSLRIFVPNGVRVFKLKDKRTGKSVFESDVEISNVIFEDIWYFFRIRDDALNLRLSI